MLTGEIRNQVDQIWDAFWSGGVSNPLSVIEQLTYLLFIKRLDDLQTLEVEHIVYVVLHVRGKHVRIVLQRAQQFADRLIVLTHEARTPEVRHDIRIW